MGKLNTFRILSILLCFSIISCEKHPSQVHVTEVIIDATSLTLKESETAVLTAYVIPADADNQMIVWSSSDVSVVSVSDGVITAVAPGVATITAKSDDGGKIAFCEITVIPTRVTGILLNREYIDLAVGGETTLTAEVEPPYAVNKNVSWKSTDENIAIVSDGFVKAVAPGTATITVTAEDQEWVCANCLVKVLPEGTIVFEDINFKNYCVFFHDTMRSNANSNHDGEVQYTEAETVLGISCTNQYIYSLVGIEHYINLQRLLCDQNNISGFDISNNSSIYFLNCCFNPLGSLDVSKNLKLTYLYCYADSLSNLDLSNNLVLKKLDCRCNQLTSLDVSNNLELEMLYCSDNPDLKEIWLRKGQTIPDMFYDENIATIKYKD